MQSLYKIHVRIRGIHDQAYRKSKKYKKYTDHPLSSKLHHVTMWGFIASFATFTFLQYLAPELFNFATPNKVYAGSDSVSWDSNTQFAAAENDGNLAINGLENASFFKVKNSTVFNFGNASDGKLVVDGTTVTIDKPEGGAVEYTRTPATNPTLFEGNAYIINLDGAIGGGLNQYYFSTVELKNGAVITHSLGATGSSGVQGIELYATGSITVSANSKIDVTGKGNNPLGKSTTGTGSATPGGSYGGVGGTSFVNSLDPYFGRQPYGTAAGVEYFGASGRGANEVNYGQYGGGRIKISSNVVILNGQIQANGKAGSNNSGGGSGGGIYIAASQLNYTSYISAAGAAGKTINAEFNATNGLNGSGGSSRHTSLNQGCLGGLPGVGGDGGDGATGGSPYLVCSNGGASAGAGSIYNHPSSSGGGAAGRIAIYYGTVNGGAALGQSEVQESSSNIVRSGTWETDFPIAGHISSPATYAAGTSLTYTFTGLDKIRWVGAKRYDGGKANVILTEQGQSPQTTVVDTFNSPKSCVNICGEPECIYPPDDYNQLFYESGLLDQTKTYTLQIVQRSDKNAASDGYRIIFDQLTIHSQNISSYTHAFKNTTATPGVTGPYAYYTNVTPYLSSSTLGGTNTASSKIGLRNDVGKKVRWNSISVVGTVPVGTTVKFLGRFSDTLGTGDFVNPQTKVKDVWSTTIPPGTYTSANPAVIDISSQALLSSTIELYVALTAGSDSPSIDTVIANYDTLEAPLNTNTTLKKTNNSALKDSSGNEIAAGIPGGLTNETSVKVVTTGLTCTDCATPINNPYIEVEYKPTGSNFTGTSDIVVGTVDGSNISTATLTGLTSGTGYHLQMRTKDAAGRVSGWTPYGDNAESLADFTIDQNLPTVSTTGWKTKTNTTISQVSGTYYSTSQDIKLSVSINDTGGSNLSTIQLSNDGTNWGSVTVANGTDSLPNTADDIYTYVPNGTYSLSTSSYTGDLPWQLTTGDAAKPVYARVYDNAGNVSGQIQDNGFNLTTGGSADSVIVASSGVKLSGVQTTASLLNQGYYWWDDDYTGACDYDEGVDNNFMYTHKDWSACGEVYTYGRISFIKFTNSPATSAFLNVNFQNPIDIYIDSIADYDVLDVTDAALAQYSRKTITTTAGFNALDVSDMVAADIAAGRSVSAFRISTPSSVLTQLTSPSLVLIQNYPYATSGAFTSRYLNSGLTDPIYGTFNPVQSTTDGSTNITYQVRAGDTAAPDASWTNWIVATPSQSINQLTDGSKSIGGKQYLQYQATLTTSDNTKTPVLDDVFIDVLNATSASITLDLTPPAQVSSITGYSTADPGTRTTLDPTNPAQWYEHASPYFDWTANADADIAGYKYCFGLNTCTPTTTLATDELTMDLTSTANYPDKIYYLRVIGYDRAGNESTTVTEYIYRFDRNKPGAVTNYITNSDETIITVNWQAVSPGGGSAITYVLERIPYLTYLTDGYSKEDVGPDKIWSNLTTYKAFAPTAATSITESITDDLVSPNRLIGGVKYAYRIRAYDQTGKFSELQNDVFFGLTRDGTNPTPPTGVSASACSYQAPENCETTDNGLKGHQITVRWSPGIDAGTGIIAYEVHRAMTNETLESSYQLMATINVPNPLPVMDEYTTLVYRDNNLTDYTTYHYRIVAVDGAASEDGMYPANKSRIVENISNFANYASTNTPDVTPPSTPVVTVNAGSLDSSNEHQKMLISWPLSTDTGIGNVTYKLYKANRADSTDQSSTLTDGDFVEYTNNANVTCVTINTAEEKSFQCEEQGLLDYTWYYYRATATDGANNTTAFSATGYAKTLSSAVPSPPRGRKDPETQVYEKYPYVYATKGNPTTPGSTVGKEIKVTFTGSYEKDCVIGPNFPCLVKYEVYRSTDKTNWSKVGDDITPIRIDNDTDNQYVFTDSTVASETRYYYQVRAVGNNPDVSLAANTTPSGIDDNLKYQGWDIVPDVTGPSLPTELMVKDIHDDGVNFKRNIITWQRISTPTRGVNNDFSEYRIYKSTDGLIWTQILVDGENPLYNSDKEIALATNYYMDLIPVAEANQYYYYYVTAVDDAGSSFRYDANNIINAFSNESLPPRDSENRIIAVSLNPAIAKPSITNQSSGLKAKIYDIGVSSATIEWTADQPSDSVVEFKPVGETEWITIGDRVMKNYNESHIVHLFGLNPETTYNYKIISRNSLGNEDIIGDTTGELALLPGLTTSGFTITPGSVTTTTTTTEITWTTNLDASSAFVEYQLQRQPGDEPQGGTAGVDPESLIASTKNHRVIIKGLRSARTYTYKIKSISSDGYLSESPEGEFANFKTRAYDSAQFTLTPASSNVAERNITATTAQIVWQTETPSTSWVDYSTTSGTYDNAAGNNDLVGTHVVVIEGLIPGTTYFYRVRVKDANEIEYTSQEYSFTAVLKPKISNMTVKNITPYGVTIAWDTNVDTETIVNWGTSAAYGEKRGKSGVSKVHELTIDNLLDNQEYHYQILAKDDAGNEVADTDKIVRTPLDTEGPKISNVKIDVLPMGENDATSSVIVSWQTNKPASTLVEYDEGVIGGSYGRRSVEDTSLNNSHTVIIKDLAPATSYHYRLVSQDKRSNKTVSQDYTFVTPSKEKSILQLIIKSLEETFAWTKNLNQFFGNIGNRLTGR